MPAYAGGAAGAAVEELTFDKSLTLKQHEAARQLGTGPGVNQTLATGAGDFNFLVGV